MKKACNHCGYRLFRWSEWRDLNSRPLDPQSSALPTALHPDMRLTSRSQLMYNSIAFSKKQPLISKKMNFFEICSVQSGFRQIFADPNEPRAMISVPVHNLAPQGGRPHPDTAFPVQCAIHHHRFQGLRMTGYIQQLIFVPLEMAVPPRLKLRQPLHTYSPHSVSAAHPTGKGQSRLRRGSRSIPAPPAAWATPAWLPAGKP